MIKHRDEHGEETLTASLDPEHTFRAGDVLLVLGPNEHIRYLRMGVPRAARS